MNMIEPRLARDLRSGSGLTANRKNLPNASELYPAFDVSSCSPQPARTWTLKAPAAAVRTEVAETTTVKTAIRLNHKGPATEDLSQ
jgi:hypothetical protein